MKRFYYLLSLLFVFIIPTSIQAYFVLDRIPIINLVVFITAITFLGSIWDIWATRHGRRDPIWLWQFNYRETLGIKIFDLPIEEYLFYITSSTYIVFVWEGIKFALETHNIAMYFILPCLSVWSLLAIFVLYFIKAKNDKL
jgi:lycopene cyclase domain-containing protein